MGGGGCALNTARVFQWLSPTPSSAVFLGGLGKDDSGAVLESLVNSDAVLTAFAKQEDLPTGHCIALTNLCPFSKNKAAVLMTYGLAFLSEEIKTSYSSVCCFS